MLGSTTGRILAVVVLATAVGAAIVGVRTYRILDKIREQTESRPVTIDQMREIVLDAVGQEGGMVETPITDVHGRTHRVRTYYREKGHEEETEDEFNQRHITRCRKVKAAWDQVPP